MLQNAVGGGHSFGASAGGGGAGSKRDRTIDPLGATFVLRRLFHCNSRACGISHEHMWNAVVYLETAVRPDGRQYRVVMSTALPRPRSEPTDGVSFPYWNSDPANLEAAAQQYARMKLVSCVAVNKCRKIGGSIVPIAPFSGETSHLLGKRLRERSFSIGGHAHTATEYALEQGAASSPPFAVRVVQLADDSRLHHSGASGAVAPVPAPADGAFGVVALLPAPDDALPAARADDALPARASADGLGPVPRRRHLMSNANFPRTRTRLCFSFVALEYSKLAAEFEESMVC